MNIACATDDKFVQHCGVMLTSLFENNQKENITVYLLTEGLTTDHEISIRNIVEKYKQRLVICRVDKSILDGFPLFPGDHVSMAAYLRLLLPRIVPENINKILYLDGDIIIRGILKELWEMDVSSYPLGAVPESTSYLNDNYLRLQYDPCFSYFNSGVLLVNLDFWRKDNSIEKCFDYLKMYPERVRWHDQDILNGVFHEHWLRLPIRWNALEGYFYTGFYDNSSIPQKVRNSIKTEIKQAVVIHYCSKIKPWNSLCIHPLKSLYYKYLMQTEWKDIRPVYCFNMRKMKLYLHGMLVFLKIKKPVYLNLTNLFY